MERKAATVLREQESAEPRRRPQGKTATVMLIEDEPDLNRALSFSLRQSGLRVLQSYDGIGALQSVSKSPPDLILLDLGLPRLHGFGVLHRLRTIRAAGNLPVVLITGDDDPEIEARAKAWDVQTVLRKPIRVRELVSIVHRLIDSTRS